MNRTNKVVLLWVSAILMAAVLLSGCGARQQAESTPAESSSASSVPAPTPGPTPVNREVLPQYQEMYEAHPDLFGWLKVDNTMIDYPVMHTPDEPERYLRKDMDGNYFEGGTLFMDARCSLDSDDFIIYGHNMNDGTMFRDILKYKDEAYWQEHQTMQFDTLYEEREYEVLAAFYDRVYYTNETCFKFYNVIDVESEEEFDEVLRNYKEKSLYDTGVTAEFGDQLITLCTCSYHHENGRFVVVARARA